MFANFDRGTIHLPLGINEMQVDLNPVDIGSIIGFALSQNIYFDALVNQGYFGIDDWLE